MGEQQIQIYYTDYTTKASRRAYTTAIPFYIILPWQPMQPWGLSLSHSDYTALWSLLLHFPLTKTAKSCTREPEGVLFLFMFLFSSSDLLLLQNYTYFYGLFDKKKIQWPHIWDLKRYVAQRNLDGVSKWHLKYSFKHQVIERC